MISGRPEVRILGGIRRDLKTFNYIFFNLQDNAGRVTYWPMVAACHIFYIYYSLVMSLDAL